MIKFLHEFGKYWILMGKVFSKPENYRVYYKQTMREFISLGLYSIGIVIIISVFMGAVITLQTAYNTDNPIYPTYLIGLGCRDSIILEFSSTVIALILAGKVGSNITSEIGTMRVTEQIDALEMMGVNSASFLILPKIMCNRAFQSLPDTAKYSCGNWRRLDSRGSIGCCYFSKFHLRDSVCFIPIILSTLSSKLYFCIYNQLSCIIPRLFCSGRIPGGGQGKYKGSGLQQYPDITVQCHINPANAVMIRVKNLYKSFEGRTVLEDIRNV
jgi:hypothetical protein